MGLEISQFCYSPRVIGFWKIVLLGTGFLSAGTALIDYQGFWNNYLFDIVFPSYLYIFIRGIYQGKDVHQRLTRWSPSMVFGLLIGITFSMEICQYFGYYKGHFDPIDFFAYLSLLGPCYLADRWLLSYQKPSGSDEGKI